MLELPSHHHPRDSGAAVRTSEMMPPTANQNVSGMVRGFLNSQSECFWAVPAGLSKESYDWLSREPGAMEGSRCGDGFIQGVLASNVHVPGASHTRIAGTAGLPACDSVTLHCSLAKFSGGMLTRMRCKSETDEQSEWPAGKAAHGGQLCGGQALLPLSLSDDL